MTLIWKANFENGDFSEILQDGYGEAQTSYGGQISVVEENRFNGRFVGKAEIATTPASGTAHAKAVRWEPWRSVTPYTQAYFGVALYIPASFNAPYPAGWANLTQLHDTGVGTTIQAYLVVARGSDGVLKFNLRTQRAGVETNYWTGPAIVGKWITVVFFCNFIRNGNLKLWIDGSLVADINGDFRTTTGLASGFFDAGLYQSYANPVQYVLFDEMKVATTLAEATPVYSPYVEPVTYPCPYGDATFNTQAELDTHIVTHWQPIDSSNLARIPEDWGLEYAAPPTIIFVDHYVYHTPGRPSIRLDPHTAADVNTAREVNPLVYHRVKAGDHIIFRCWIKTNPSTLEPPDPANPVSLYAGARIGIDFYGDDMSSGKNGAITGISSPTLPQTDEGVLQNYVHWGSDWEQRTIEFDVPATAISELNGLAYPVTALGCWLQCWSSTHGANDPALAWFADAELTIIPSVPPPTIKYICPFDNQEFLVAAEAIMHLNTVHFPLYYPTLKKWIIEFKPWPMP